MKSLLSPILWNRFPQRVARSSLSLASRWSSTTTASTANTDTSSLAASFAGVDPSTLQRPPTFTRPQILTSEDGRKMIAFDMRPHPKLKPSVVAKRLSKMRTYIGNEKNIRHSPWRLNLVCQFAAKLPLKEALLQLEFNKKSKAPLVHKVLKRTSNLADIRHGLQISQLEVAECFATKGIPLKRVKIMGRGRSGKMERKHSHIRVVLREIDFRLKIYQAKTIGQKKKWYLLQQQAEKDFALAAAKREEIKRLERETANNKTDSE